ncbi:MAG: NUDIX domain-containing protein [Phycisphaerales bacterium]|nr:MAG: NUDIX domain-containing protein [Phycisphaerales bacterium]
MPLKAKYCSQCGATIVVREVEDRQREVCSSCGKVFYRNPLPVAASVILNEDREVLLVKRKNEPKKGMWCLPIGFAEINETIADAAQRELKEETGVEGQVLRMLDVDSYESDFYGDLLIVTFEMKRTGGVEQAGDDAETISHFPLNWLPQLAFSSNEKALRVCSEAHAEEWAIQDSFSSLQADEGRELLSDALVALIQDNAQQLTKLWFDEVRCNPTTDSYSRINPDELFARGFTAISQFGRWLKGHEADQEVRAFYRTLGRERKTQGFAVHEVMSSLSLLRKHVWTYARSQGMWASPLDVYRALELDRRIALFFDKAVYHTALGFHEVANA